MHFEAQGGASDIINGQIRKKSSLPCLTASMHNTKVLEMAPLSGMQLFLMLLMCFSCSCILKCLLQKKVCQDTNSANYVTFRQLVHSECSDAEVSLAQGDA